MSVAVNRFLVILFCVVGMNVPLSARGGDNVVVTTIYPLTLIANDLGRGWLKTVQLLDNNQEPHHISLKISQREQIDNAPLILWVGPELENFLEKPLANVPEKRKLALSDAASPEDLSKQDPHYWLQPQIVKRYYRRLANRLRELYPEHADRIERNLERALERLDQAIVRAKNSQAGAEGKSVLVEHQAYQHYTDFFGITIAGALVDSRGMSAGARAVMQLRAESEAACVIVEQLPAARGISTVAADLNLDIVAIDPLGRESDKEMGYAGFLNGIHSGFQSCFALTSPQ
jgi:zinc transport system substrate-binding protein